MPEKFRLKIENPVRVWSVAMFTIALNTSNIHETPILNLFATAHYIIIDSLMKSLGDGIFANEGYIPSAITHARRYPQISPTQQTGDFLITMFVPRAIHLEYRVRFRATPPMDILRTITRSPWMSNNPQVGFFGLASAVEPRSNWPYSDPNEMIHFSDLFSSGKL